MTPVPEISRALFMAMLTLLCLFGHPRLYPQSPSSASGHFVNRNDGGLSRTHGGYYTADTLNSLRNNARTFEWARKLKQAAISKAEPWLAVSDEELWSMVPGQDLPRCIDVTCDRLTSGP